MKAALFTDTYLPNTDGVVSSILALRRGLRAAGHDWSIFAPDAPGYADPASDPVHRFRAFKFPPYPDYRAAVFPFLVPKSLAEKEGLKLVHSKAMASMAVASYKFARGARIPCVASVETMIPDGVHYLSKSVHVQGMARRFTWGYMKWLYSHFDKVTSPSSHTQKVLSGHGIDSVVLPSPVDTGAFCPDAKTGAAARARLGIKNAKMVLSVGRVVREKNYDFMLSVAKAMRRESVRFVIAGKGPYLETLKQAVAREGLSKSVSFLGFMPKSELIANYNAADAFIFPSQFETQGLTLIEAFACGKPAVVMEGTPMADAVSDGKNGYVFEDSVPDCAEKLRQCLQDSKRFSKDARRAALAYSIPSVTRRLISLYKSLI